MLGHSAGPAATATTRGLSSQNIFTYNKTYKPIHNLLLYSYRHQQSSSRCRGFFQESAPGPDFTGNPRETGMCVHFRPKRMYFLGPSGPWACLGTPRYMFSQGPVARPRPMATKDSQSSATSESQPCPLSEIWPFRVPRASLPGHAPIHVLEPKGRAQAHGHQRFTKQRRMTACTT